MAFMSCGAVRSDARPDKTSAENQISMMGPKVQATRSVPLD